MSGSTCGPPRATRHGVPTAHRRPARASGGVREQASGCRRGSHCTSTAAAAGLCLPGGAPLPARLQQGLLLARVPAHGQQAQPGRRGGQVAQQRGAHGRGRQAAQVQRPQRGAAAAQRLRPRRRSGEGHGTAGAVEALGRALGGAQRGCGSCAGLADGAQRGRAEGWGKGDAPHGGSARSGPWRRTRPAATSPSLRAPSAASG
jgi:hypothetical protein